jgi:SAM-dependent methyltransferase
MDAIAQHNRKAWDRQAREGCRWSIPVTPEEVAEARAGRPRIILTPDTPVPHDWLGELPGRDLLCLASAGGQQAPLLAAAGATVSSLDLSEEQLALDRVVAEREGLTIRTVQGDMRDLSAFSDESFDLVVHVTSNVFCPEIVPVWKECHRVLRPGGELLAGFMNPSYYLFDHYALERGEPPVAVHPLPFSDQTHLSPPELEALMTAGEALEFSHSLNDQIGGQIRAGFAIVGFFEDTWKEVEVLDRLFPTMINTRARKMIP